MERKVMLRLVSAASVLALAAGASAAPFNAVSYEAGGGLQGIAGAGFQTSAGGFYNRLGGTNVDIDSSDPTAWVESSGNHVPYDSYFALNGGGPSRSATGDTSDSLTGQIISFYSAFGVNYADDYFDASGNGTQVAGPGSHIGGSNDADGQAPFPAGTTVNQARAGLAVSPPPVPSGASPLGEGVFVGQFTLNRGATLSGGFFFTVLVQQGTGDGQNLVLNGAPVVFQTAPGVFQPLVLRSYLVGTNDNLSHSRSGGNAGSGTGSSQRFGAADVYHLWVEVVPTPGALALFGVGGLALARRRRA